MGLLAALAALAARGLGLRQRQVRSRVEAVDGGQQRLREAALPVGPVESYRLILGDPLQQVQRLLGHASLATTYVYLDHIATRADTVDAAVEELLALLPGPQGA